MSNVFVFAKMPLRLALLPEGSLLTGTAGTRCVLVPCHSGVNCAITQLGPGEFDGRFSTTSRNLPLAITHGANAHDNVGRSYEVDIGNRIGGCSASYQGCGSKGRCQVQHLIHWIALRYKRDEIPLRQFTNALFIPPSSALQIDGIPQISDRHP
jgi:hypothetical protein